MKILSGLIGLSLLTFGNILAQDSEELHFLTPYEGEWSGTLEIYSLKGKVNEITAELHFAPTDSAHRWGWKIVYLADTVRDERPYDLITIDKEKGLYQIDEKNSIFLDATLFDNTLSSRFSVDNSLLIINYRFEEEQIYMEIFVGGKKEAVETGKEIDTVGEILSYPVGSMHRAVLTRKKESDTE